MLIDFNSKDLKNLRKGDVLIYGDNGFTVISLDDITKDLKEKISDLKKEVYNLQKQVENTEKDIKDYKYGLSRMVKRFIVAFKGGNE